MIDVAIISGTGFYAFPGLERGEDIEVSTKYGEAKVKRGVLEDLEIAHISRHGEGHTKLPNLINHRANLLALKELDTKAIVGTTVCGVLNPSLPLAKLAVFEDLYFPENRLPNGEICTVYDEEGHRLRGHYIFGRPFSGELRSQLIAAAENPVTDAVYAHANGPRFNSKPEIKMLQEYASFVSQTAGPEAVLAGELEIPYALLGFGVDYANGVKDEPTPVEVLAQNLEKSKTAFIEVITKFLENFARPRFEGFIYRFESG